MNTMLTQRLSNGLFRKAQHACFPTAALAVALGGLAPNAAWAQDSSAVPAIAAAAAADTMNSLLGRIAPATLPAAPPRVTVEQAPASDNSLDAYGRPIAQVGGVSYRWWITRGAWNFGVGLGTLGHIVPSPEAGGPQVLTYGTSVVTVGTRFQVNRRSTVFADASGARRFDADTADRISTKVGVEWKARSNKLGLDGASRSLALQLDSGYRMSLKVRRNGIGVYVKGQF